MILMQDRHYKKAKAVRVAKGEKIPERLNTVDMIILKKILTVFSQSRSCNSDGWGDKE
jgi:hypothetical protein